MELRTAAVLLLLLCASIFITTEGLIPNCCLSTTDKFKLFKIKNVEKYHLQSDAGPCEIKALIIHVKNKRYCLDLKYEKLVEKVMRKHAPKQKKQ
ncbi:hypothetical protein AMELA_G00260330 [Ameiurus melas]|uniref:Chemokine interleukin-8-like domain-containing protein n=1 Tax=Ameiurus melas TaxID=219545 RepID=A0A7J5ZNH1_AMEME|nr:hypothetical protein AMELA_G00260330 [Ameiurus melas]